MAVINDYIFSQDKVTMTLGISMPVWVAFLIILRIFLNAKHMGLTSWRIMCFIPVFFCLIHFSLKHFKGYYKIVLSSYVPIYIAGLLIALWAFVDFFKFNNYIVSGVIFTLALVGMLTSIINTVSSYALVGNYSRVGYSECFHNIVNDMQKNYCLNDWKKIDYDLISKKVAPKVLEAENSDDEVMFYEALTEYCYYMYDSHVEARYTDEEGKAIYMEAKDNLSGNDYGFSMFTLSNGLTVAIDVLEDSEAFKLGIKNGTVITKWDGYDIDDAKAMVKCIYPGLAFPTKENEDIVRSIFLAGKGEEKIDVSFLSDNGIEKTVSINKIGPYSERLDFVLGRLYDSNYNEGDWLSNEHDKDNFFCKMINEDCGYMVVNREHYKGISDALAASRGEYKEISDMVYDKLAALKDKGMKYLVIDARNNTGGYDEISGAIAALFSNEDIYTYSFGIFKKGKYISDEPHFARADGRLSDLKVVVLTNARCMSAGDSLMYYLSKCKNVTIMGITRSSCVNQNVGGICVTTEGHFALVYPYEMTLTPENEPFIDTNYQRKPSVDLDVRIPVNIDNVDIIFGHNYVDYELDYALDYIDKECR